MFNRKVAKANKIKISIAGVLGILVLAACSANPPPSSSPESDPLNQPEQDFQIVTLLPQDAIPAIDDPVYYSAGEADVEYDPDELVLGLSINDDARAYSVGVLSSHEIVNDTVGGQQISVTW
jgi:hypothetical protein